MAFKLETRWTVKAAKMVVCQDGPTTSMSLDRNPLPNEEDDEDSGEGARRLQQIQQNSLRLFEGYGRKNPKIEGQIFAGLLSCPEARAKPAGF
jgi:hypothetical protein